MNIDRQGLTLSSEEVEGLSAGGEYVLSLWWTRLLASDNRGRGDICGLGPSPVTRSNGLPKLLHELRVEGPLLQGPDVGFVGFIDDHRRDALGRRGFRCLRRKQKRVMDNKIRIKTTTTAAIAAYFAFKPG